MKRPAFRCRSGFTLVELLVVIGIIAVMISLLMPVLSMAREHAKRIVCASNLRQFSMSLYLYANQNKGWLISGVRNPPSIGGDGSEHLPFVSDVVYDWVTFTVGSQVLTCPNMEGCPNQEEPYGWVLGYNYLCGHTSLTWAGIPWQSPQKITDVSARVPGGPLLPYGDSLPMLCDFTFLSDADSWAPHGSHGYVGGPADTDPALFGSKGGNVALLDGSVQWRAESWMHKYSSRPFDGVLYFAYW